MSAGSAIRPSSRNLRACFSPRPSMSITPREAKCFICWKVWPGQPRQCASCLKTGSCALVVGGPRDALAALAQVLARQVLLVVKGGRRDGDTADVDRLEHRERDQAAVAAD